MLGSYVRASTANPTGWRPWNSRLSYYVPNSFPVPTLGQGPFLLNPGIAGRPSANGGLGDDGTISILGVSLDPTTFFVGLGLLFAAVYFLGSGRPKRRARRLRRRISRSKQQLKSLAV